MILNIVDKINTILSTIFRIIGNHFFINSYKFNGTEQVGSWIVQVEFREDCP